MSKSDPDIYAKVDGDPAQARILDDASPLERETPPSLIETETTTPTGSEQDTIVDIDSTDWALAHITRPSGGTTCAFLDAGNMEAGDEPGTVRVQRPSQVIRRVGTRRLAGEDIDVLSLQRPDSNVVEQHVSQDERSGQLLITSDPFDSRRGPEPSGPDTDILCHHGDWFVCRDANNRDRRTNDCYETYFPEAALQFRDHTHYDRPPIEVVEDECVAIEWDGPSGSFGVISTEVVRVGADAVPASDERMREIEHNAQQ